YSLESTDFPFTVNSPSSVIHSSQGRALVFSKSSSKEVALNSPILSNTLSAVLSQRFAIGISFSVALKVTFPLSTAKSLYPKFNNSFFTTASNPKVDVAINSISAILPSFLERLILLYLKNEIITLFFGLVLFYLGNTYIRITDLIKIN